MKKIIAAVLAVIMLFAMGVTAFAMETPGWLDTGLGWLKDTANSVMNNLSVWKEEVENTISGICSDPEVQAAWNTLKEAAEHAGSVSKEAVLSAYNTVKAWMEANHVGETALYALDQLASAAGIDQDQLDSWTGSVGEFFASGKEAVSAGLTEAWNALMDAGSELTGAKERDRNEQRKVSKPILYTCYRQMGWGDRVEIAYVDEDGGLWMLSGHDSELRWPYDAQEQIRYMQEKTFQQIGSLAHSELLDLKSLVSAVKSSDASPHPAADDAGTERTVAIRYDREGNNEPVLLGMSGDDCFENTDPNAQGLYLLARRLFPQVTCYASPMGPAGFIPVKIADFCALGDLTGATVKAWEMDCESGPSEIVLNEEQQEQILDDVKNGVVTGKVSAIDTTGGYTEYGFYRDEKHLGTISIYEGLLYWKDGMYSIERQN